MQPARRGGRIVARMHVSAKEMKSDDGTSAAFNYSLAIVRREPHKHTRMFISTTNKWINVALTVKYLQLLFLHSLPSFLPSLAALVFLCLCRRQKKEKKKLAYVKQQTSAVDHPRRFAISTKFRRCWFSEPEKKGARRLKWLLTDASAPSSFESSSRRFSPSLYFFPSVVF